MRNDHRLFGISRLVSIVALTAFIAIVSIGQTSEQLEPVGLPHFRLGLKVVVPGNPPPFSRPQLPGDSLIRRNMLLITDAQAASDFTAVDLSSREEGDAIRLSLSVIYNDLSNPEWSKDKHEKAVGSYLIHPGELLSTVSLKEFGIAPFEVSVVRVEPRKLKPGEDFPIRNNTSSLEVVFLDTLLDMGSLMVKNASDKKMVNLKISAGHALITGNVIAAGAFHRMLVGNVEEIVAKGITIDAVVFDDLTTEGDPRLGLEMQAKEKGVRIQMPRVLAMVNQALQAGDDAIEARFVKLEADLWVIPEAITKNDALELLKSDFPALDDNLIAELYEQLKGGLYDARNDALSTLGELKRRLGERRPAESEEILQQRAQRIREEMTGLREQLERIGEGKRR
jgi:hypothetical protein